MAMRHVGNRNGKIQATTEQWPVTSGVTVTDGDFVKLASGRVTNASLVTGKLYGTVLGGPNNNLVSRTYRNPATLGNSGGTNTVLVELCEGQEFSLDVNGLLASDAEGSYYNLLNTAQSLLTSDATAPANNDTVTIGTQVYTFKTTLTGAAYEVLINTTAAAALTNLKAAVNLTGTIGTDYGTGTLINSSVTATTKTATTLLFEATDATQTGKLIPTTETSAHLSFNNATLLGGTGAQYVDNTSKSATVGQLFCVKRVATDAAGTVFNRGRFVVSAPQSATTPT